MVDDKYSRACDPEFQHWMKEFYAATFDELGIRTMYSEVLPWQTNLESKFSRNVSLKKPFVSAAMDTVTEHDMAIAMALFGGMGILHKNLNPKEQARQAGVVKRHLSGIVMDPYAFRKGDTYDHILEVKEREGHKFDTYPILDDDDRLVGIVTQHHLKYKSNSGKKASEFMAKNPVTGPVDMSSDDALKRMEHRHISTLPLTNSDGKIVAMYVLSDLQGITSGKFDEYNLDDKNRLRVGAAVGVPDAMERVPLLMAEGIDVVVLDTAHGDSKGVIDTLKEIKRKYGSLDVVAGNVSEGYSAKRLLDAGADGIKVGQGPGSICTTRTVTGVGKPQLSAVYECEFETRGENQVPICADGGLVKSGDMAKAFVAGGHSVMMGSMLAGMDQSPGEIIDLGKKGKFKSYRGMGSKEAMEANQGSRERYGQTSEDIEKNKKKPTAEGVAAKVPYKGNVLVSLEEYAGGLQSSMGYVGARTVEEFRKKARFFRMGTAGIIESRPHDIVSD